MYFFFIIIAIILVDQGVKHWITQSFSLYETMPLIGDRIALTHIHNQGAAFSLLEGHSLLLIFVPGFFLLVGLVYLWRHKTNRGKVFLLGISFVIGGGIGNLLDRAIQGHVVDMFQVGTFPVFNVADIFITVGCGLIAIYTLFFDGKKHGKR